MTSTGCRAKPDVIPLQSDGWGHNYRTEYACTKEMARCLWIRIHFRVLFIFFFFFFFQPFYKQNFYDFLFAFQDDKVLPK